MKSHEVSKMNYYILCTPRTGSTLLCKFLKQLKLGKPYELASDHALSSEERTIDSLKKDLEGRRSGGYCGVKVVRPNIDYVNANIQKVTSTYNLLYDLLEDPKFIYLYRHDIVAQAVSNVKHELLGRFHIYNDKDQIEYEKREAELSELLTTSSAERNKIYDRLHLEMAYLYKEMTFWNSFFSKHHIEPFSISFESFMANKMGTVEIVSHFLGNFVSLSDGDLKEEIRSTRTNLNKKLYNRMMNVFEKHF